MVLDHLFVIQRLLIKSVKNVSDKYACASASHFPIGCTAMLVWVFLL